MSWDFLLVFNKQQVSMMRSQAYCCPCLWGVTEEPDELCTAHVSCHHQTEYSCTGMCGGAGKASCETMQ